MKTIILLLLTLLPFHVLHTQPYFQWENNIPYYQMNWGHGVKVLVDSTNTPLVLAMHIGWEVTPFILLYKLNIANGSALWLSSTGPTCNGQFIFLDSANN